MAGAWLAHGTSINESGKKDGIREKKEDVQKQALRAWLKTRTAHKGFFSCMAPTAQPSDVH